MNVSTQYSFDYLVLGYSIADLKTDLGSLYIKAGQKGIGTVFLMTDSQVADEKFLVLINDMLASGEIPSLFADDAIEEIIGAMRNEVKSQGIDDTRENIWKFFIEKVRRNLKVTNIIFCLFDKQLINEYHRSFCASHLSVQLFEFDHENSQLLQIVLPSIGITNGQKYDWNYLPSLYSHLFLVLGSFDFGRQSVC